MPETSEFRTSKIDSFGSEAGNSHYAVGWAWALNTPYRWTKAVPSHFGAMRNALE